VRGRHPGLFFPGSTSHNFRTDDFLKPGKRGLSGDSKVQGIQSGLISGSGQHDRDETLDGHKPFLVIVDHLTRNGIEVLRFDDRGAGKSTSEAYDATPGDKASDANAAFAWLLGRTDSRHDAIGFIGHSESGLIGPIAMASNSKVAFLVSLAGPAIDVIELMRSQRDGLYWQKMPGGRRSPLGDLVADAATEGYDVNKSASTPFRGYHYRILTAQGPAAPGGKKSYIVNGDMRDGFALLAYPAKYASSGVMTFIIGQDGVVYQKDLGKDATTQAPLLAEYNPDKSWTAVQ